MKKRRYPSRKGLYGTSMRTVRTPKKDRKRRPRKPAKQFSIDKGLDPAMRRCPVCDATAGAPCLDQEQPMKGLHRERRTSTLDPGPLPKESA